MSDVKPPSPFLELLSAELETLKRTGRKISFRAGQIIFNQGDVGDGIYIVEEGEVEITAMVDGERKPTLSLSRLRPRDFFGEMAVLDEEPRSATATAAVDTVVSFVPSAETLRALSGSPELLTALVRELCLRIRQFDRRFVEKIRHEERLSVVGRFAQAIVHDFKNPLNIIGFAAELAASENSTPEDRNEGKTQIGRQVDRLTNMINELLEFTSGSSRALNLAPTNYRGFVEEFLKEIRPEAAEKSVTIECENPPPDLSLALDQGRLLHVLYNLVNNAIDAMPGGGKIVLRFSVQDRYVVTEMEDSGMGLAPEIASKLFEPFVTHGKPHGTGLGLSICKRIIEDHGGQISARSEPGRGAVFTFTLPLPE